jgi:dihydrofolate reductase
MPAHQDPQRISSVHIRNLSLIVAMDSLGTIGNDGHLPWPDIKDAKWFRDKTLHQSCIMGRKTHDSIIARNGQPLEKRTSVVLSHRPWFETWPQPGVDHQGVRWARDPLEALDMASWGWQGGGTSDAVVIGGAQIYEIFLPLARTIYLTLVEGAHYGKTVFPGRVPSTEIWKPAAEPLKFEGFSCHILCRAPGVPSAPSGDS